MEQKRKPTRTCIGCMKPNQKENLIRIVDDQQKGIQADLKGKANGRGCYLCPKIECLELAKKKKGFQRTFKRDVKENEIEDIKLEVQKYAAKD